MLTVFSCSNQLNGKNELAQDNAGKICRVEKVTGSHIDKRVCRTPAEVEREERKSKQLLNTVHRKANSKTWGDPGT